MLRFTTLFIAAFLLSVICISADETKLLPDVGAAGDEFGSSVSIFYDYAAVGVPGDDEMGEDAGAVYLYKRTGSTWDLVEKFTAYDGAAGDGFGSSVHMYYNYFLIVGAPYDDDNGSNSGSVYVFEKTWGVWDLEVKLTASDGAAGDQFGYSVTMGNHRAIIGCPFDDDFGTSSGSVYIYNNNTAWTESKLNASDASENDLFGISVNARLGNLIVGAHKNDDHGSESGSAYIFRLQAVNDWIEKIKLTASDASAGDWFGYSVSIGKDYAIVGAYKDDAYGNNSGSAYIFERDGENWSESKKLTPNDAATDDWFGVSVSICEDYAIVGAPREDGGGYSSGSVYLFERDGSDWIENAKITPSDAAPNDFSCSSVCITRHNNPDLDNFFIVGSIWDDDNGDLSGSAYIYSQYRVWVDDDYSETGWIGQHIWGYDAFNNIQDAIDAVDYGTVMVNEGTYTENLNVNKDIRIFGDGVDETFIQASGDEPDGAAPWNGRIFEIGTGHEFEIRNSTLRNGETSDYGGGIYNEGSNLIFDNCILGNNGCYPGSGTTGGGMLFSDGGTISISNCLIRDNYSSRFGGAFLNMPGSELTLRNSTLSENTSEWDGGCIFNKGRVDSYNCTFSDNESITGAGCISNDAGASGYLRNSIFANSLASLYDLSGTFDFVDYCLVEIATGFTISSGGSNITGADPALGALAENGGPTLTYSLLPGSPCLDMGDNTHTTSLSFDQRGPGFQRIVNFTVDMGSYEEKPEEVWVDDDYCETCTNDGHTWGYNAFDNVQDGIDWVGNSTVNVAAGVYTENIEINKDVDIIGAGPKQTIIQASVSPPDQAEPYSGRIMYVMEGANASVSGFTFRYGENGEGGAILTYRANLIVEKCIFHNNYARANGGSVKNLGECEIKNSTFYDNESGNEGAAIYNSQNLYLTNCTISHNICTVAGGGLSNYGPCVINHCTFVNNESSTYGGGISGEMYEMKNSIVADNIPRDCFIEPEDNINNLIGDGLHTPPALSGDPMLGPLTDNGGPTMTHALLTGSPCIDQADPATTTSADQRSYMRNGLSDIGAFEYEGTPPEPWEGELPEENLALWLDASNVLNGDTPLPDSFFDIWYDLTVPAENASTSDENQQPTWRANAINGRPAVEFITDHSATGYGLSDVLVSPNDAGIHDEITTGVTDRWTPDPQNKSYYLLIKTGDYINEVPDDPATSPYYSDGRQCIFEIGGPLSGLNTYLSNGKLCIGAWNRFEQVFTILDDDGDFYDISGNSIYLVRYSYDGLERRIETSIGVFHPGDPSSTEVASIGPICFNGLTRDNSTTENRDDKSGIGAACRTRFHDYSDGSTYSCNFNGMIGEVILYNSATVDDVVLNYIDDKYGTNFHDHFTSPKKSDWIIIEKRDNLDEIVLSDASPNPFSKSCTFAVNMNESSNIRIDLFNSIGEKVQQIYYGSISKGIHEFSIDGRNLENGMYIYKVRGENFVRSGKVILSK